MSLLLLLKDGGSGSGVSITGAGQIASAEIVGAPAIGAGVSASALASAEAIGSAVVAAVVTATGIATQESIGAPTVAAGIQSSGIVSAEALGNAALAAGIVGTGVASQAASGSPAVGAGVATTGLSSGESIGGASVASTVVAAGIASAESVGQPTVSTDTGAGEIVCLGIASDEACGLPTIGIGNASTGGGPDVFDAPYQAYVKRVTAERASAWRESLAANSAPAGTDKGLAISPAPAYDSAREVASKADAKTPAVAAGDSRLSDADHGIQAARQAVERITRSAIQQASAQRVDDDAMLLMMLALADDD